MASIILQQQLLVVVVTREKSARERERECVRAITHLEDDDVSGAKYGHEMQNKNQCSIILQDQISSC